MAGFWRVSGAGRGLLVLGAAILLASLLYPPLTWFTLSGGSPELPAGTYTGFQTMELLNSLADGSFAALGLLSYLGFLLLFLCTNVAIAVAAIGRRTRNVGTVGIVILLFCAGLLYLTTYQLNLPLTGPGAAISIEYGFVAAVVGGALIEAGGRWRRASPMRRVVPAVAFGEENP